MIALFALLPVVAASLRGWSDACACMRATRSSGSARSPSLPCGVWLVPMLVAALGNGGADYRAYVDDILLRQTVTRYANA